MLAILLSSFGKLLVVPMMVWDYDLAFAYAIQLFVLSSNRLALQTRERPVVGLSFLTGSCFQCSGTRAWLERLSLC